MLLKNFRMFLIVCVQMTFAINSIIFLDLWLTLRNPFYPRGRRAKWYYLFIVSVGVSSALF